MQILAIFTIIFISAAQSIFGVGVLLFGTPLFLLFGYEYITALYMLLPISIFISLFQTFNYFREIEFKFYLGFLIFSIPFVVFFLKAGVVNNIDFGLLVGMFLIIISLKKTSIALKFFFDFITKFERINFIIMGILHGLTNLGGSLLTAMVFNKELSKNKTRSTIAICYATFAIFQLITLFLLIDKQSHIINNNIIFFVIGIATFFFTEKFIYLKINKQKYEKSFSLFLFVSGLSLIIKKLGTI